MVRCLTWIHLADSAFKHFYAPIKVFVTGCADGLVTLWPLWEALTALQSSRKWQLEGASDDEIEIHQWCSTFTRVPHPAHKGGNMSVKPHQTKTWRTVVLLWPSFALCSWHQKQRGMSVQLQCQTRNNALWCLEAVELNFWNTYRKLFRTSSSFKPGKRKQQNVTLISVTCLALRKHHDRTMKVLTTMMLSHSGGVTFCWNVQVPNRIMTISTDLGNAFVQDYLLQLCFCNTCQLWRVTIPGSAWTTAVRTTTDQGPFLLWA